MGGFRRFIIAGSLALWALLFPGRTSAPAQSQSAASPVREAAPTAEEGSPGNLPPALPDLPPALPEEPDRFRSPGTGAIDWAPDRVPGELLRPLRLADAIRRSLANVQIVQANVAVRSAQVAQFDALKQFVPLVNLPQFMAGFNQFNSGKDTLINFPDVMGFTQFAGLPGLNHLAASRVNLLLPLDPSGQITALPIAEEGVRAKLLMEQLVRRSQAALAIQHYFEAKQLQYGIRVGRMAVDLAQETLGFMERKLLEKQAYEVEVSQARIDESKARVLLAGLEKNSRIAQRQLGVVMHQSRLLVPQDRGPMPIELDPGYSFDLDDPDLVELTLVPDFPRSREEAVQLAKRQRVEVRILVVGLRIARLRNQRAWIRLFGSGGLPAELSLKNANGVNHGVALGAIFGALYSPPLVDVGVWASIRQAKLDVIQSQLDLEKALIDVANDAGNAWDRWQQAIKEWVQMEAELGLRHEYLARQQRLFREKQSIGLDVLGAQLNALQADANRWTAWYNLQLARLDVLRSTEQLLDYVEKAGIADFPAERAIPPPGHWKRLQLWLTRNRSGGPPREEETSHGWQGDESLLAAGLGGNGGAGAGLGTGRRAAAAATGTPADGSLIRAGGTAGAGDIRIGGTASAANTGIAGTAGVASAAARDGSDAASPPGISQRRVQPGRAAAQRAAADPAGRPLPGRSGQASLDAAGPGGGDDRQGKSAP